MESGLPRYGLEVIEVSDPVSPQQVGRYDAGEGVARHVTVSGEYALVGGGYWDDGARLYRDGLAVIDISDPADLRRLGGHDTVGGVEGLAVSGKYAYVTLSGVLGDSEVFRPGLHVFDVSDPANRSVLVGMPTPGSSEG